MKTFLALATLLTAAALAPAASGAQPDLEGVLWHRAVQLPQQVQGTGLLSAFVDDGGISLSPGARLDLEASRLKVQDERSTEFVQIEGVAVQQETDDPSRSALNATARGTSLGEHYYTAIFPLPDQARPTVRSSTDCLRAVPSEDHRVTGKRFVVTERDAPWSATSTALNATMCDGTIEVHGSFLVVLWDWTLTVRDDEGQTFKSTSGRDTRGSVNDPSGTTGGASTGTVVQSYVEVHDGGLWYEAAPGRRPALHMDSLQAQTDGRASFEDCTASIASAQFSSAVLHVDGSMQLDMRRSDDAITSLLLGEVAVVREDDRIVWRSTNEGAVPGGLLLLLVAAVGAVAVAGLAALPSRSWLELAERQEARLRPRTAILAATLATLRLSGDARPYYVRAQARRALGRLDAAVADFRCAWKRADAEPDKARIAYELGRAFAQTHAAQEAGAWLREAAELDTTMVFAAGNDPYYQRVEHHAAFQRQVNVGA